MKDYYLKLNKLALLFFSLSTIIPNVLYPAGETKATEPQLYNIEDVCYTFSSYLTANPQEIPLESESEQKTIDEQISKTQKDEIAALLNISKYEIENYKVNSNTLILIVQAFKKTLELIQSDIYYTWWLNATMNPTLVTIEPKCVTNKDNSNINQQKVSESDIAMWILSTSSIFSKNGKDWISLVNKFTSRPNVSCGIMPDPMISNDDRFILLIHNFLESLMVTRTKDGKLSFNSNYKIPKPILKEIFAYSLLKRPPYDVNSVNIIPQLKLFVKRHTFL